jgi:hypothetical protein
MPWILKQVQDEEGEGRGAPEVWLVHFFFVT